MGDNIDQIDGWWQSCQCAKLGACNDPLNPLRYKVEARCLQCLLTMINFTIYLPSIIERFKQNWRKMKEKSSMHPFKFELDSHKFAALFLLLYAVSWGLLRQLCCYDALHPLSWSFWCSSLRTCVSNVHHMEVPWKLVGSSAMEANYRTNFKTARINIVSSPARAFN